jgi:hypothetical protein
MECPLCKDPDAYVGFSSVDCLNPDCSHFKEPYLNQKLAEQEKGFKQILKAVFSESELEDLCNELWLRLAAIPPKFIDNNDAFNNSSTYHAFARSFGLHPSSETTNNSVPSETTPLRTR